MTPVVLVYPNDKAFNMLVNGYTGMEVSQLKDEVYEWLAEHAGQKHDVPGMLMAYEGYYILEDRVHCQALAVFSDPNVAMRFKLTWL